LVVGIVSLGLLICPMFWFPGDKIYLYGDDGALYFLAPARYLAKSVFVWSNYGGLGEVNNIMPSHLPFVAVILGLQALGLTPGQVQKLIWGLTLAGGFIFTYLVTKELSDRQASSAHIGGMVAGLAFVLSPMLAIVDWPVLLLNLYLVCAIPAILYLYLRYMRTFSGRTLAALVTTIGLTSAFLAQVPWLVPFLLGSGVLLGLYWLLVLKVPAKKMLLGHAALIGLVVLVQAFWVVPLVSFGPQAAITGGLQAIDDARLIVVNVAPRMNVYDYLLMLYPELMLSRTMRVSGLFSALYSMKFIHIVIPFVVVGALAVGNGLQRRVMSATTAALLVTLYVGTVNITPVGLRLFLWLTEHMPGWTVLRNFQAKGVMAVAFFYALAVGLALWVVGARYRRTGLCVAAAIAGILIVKGMPLVSGRIVTSPSNVVLDRGVITQVPEAYLKAMAYLNKQPGTSGTAVIPMMSFSGWGLYQWEKGLIAHNPAFLLLDNPVLNDLGSVSGSPALHGWLREAIEGRNVRLFEWVMGLTATKYVIWHEDFDYAHGEFWGLLLRSMANPAETKRFVEELEARRVVEGDRVSVLELSETSPRIYAGTGVSEW
jgi:hypothetical protein